MTEGLLTFTQLGSLLLELLNGSLVDTTTFVDQVTSGGGFTGIDVTDNDDVDLDIRQYRRGDLRVAYLYPF
jgi:hypothetical protein